MKSTVAAPPHAEPTPTRPASPTGNPFAAWIALLLAGAGVSSSAAPLVPRPALGLQLPAGFEVSVFATAALTDDIQAMAVDSQGRVVVTGPGYIRTLIDRDNDGVADERVDFATSKSGGMGLCFSGSVMLFSGDDGLWKYEDADFDGVADGPPMRVGTFKGGEHGNHAIRQGPDGSWFVLVGNDGGVHAGSLNDPRSPVRQPSAGVLLRLGNTTGQLGVYSHGLRNPYDFDFNAQGDIFAFDSDVEREFLLPWYSPTRLDHLGYGTHHGWRLPGYQRGFRSPESYAGIAAPVASMGRGSPTGVVAYRHIQFPPFYQNGLFLLDWTFGRIWFTPAIPAGSGYQADPQLFMEPIGTTGFAPTDAVVAPDGSLLVSVGGRKTRGAVYRITATSDAERRAMAVTWLRDSANEPMAVLTAPQPLEAWSRAVWQPLALRQGARPFTFAVDSTDFPDFLRIRAVEVLTELFGGLTTPSAQSAARATSPFLRARAAWSLGRMPCKDFAPILLGLAQDVSPLVRRCALEAIAEQVEVTDATIVSQAASMNSGHPDRRVRTLAAQLAGFLPLPVWKTYYETVSASGVPNQMGAALAVALRYPTNGFQSSLAGIVLKPLRAAQTRIDQLDGLSLLVRAMGDWNLAGASSEALTAYEAAFPPPERDPMIPRLQQAVRPLLRSLDPEVVWEAARVAGMLRDGDAGVQELVASRIHPASTVESDFHFLAVLSRLKAPRTPELTRRMTEGLLGMNRKTDRMADRPKQTWRDRFTELQLALTARDPGLPQALLSEREFLTLGGAYMARSFPASNRMAAATLLLREATAAPSLLDRTPENVRLLALLPADATRSLLRPKWANAELRDELVRVLAVSPEPQDRARFAWALSSPDPTLVRTGLQALNALPPDPTGESTREAIRLLVRSIRNPTVDPRPPQVVGLVNRLSGEAFAAPEDGADPASLQRSCRPIFDWFARTFPLLAADIQQSVGSHQRWENLLQSVNWSRGDVASGLGIFQARGCQNCHGGTANLGPDLSGAAKRWSPQDLFQHIQYPNLEVPEAYRTSNVATRDGRIHTGLIAFLSADGVLLRLMDGSTVRIAQQDIVSRQTGATSLMPEGLLDGMTPQNLADLHAYLQYLAAPQPSVPKSNPR